MTLIKNKAPRNGSGGLQSEEYWDQVTDDWVTIDDDAPLPAFVPVLVSLDRWVRDRNNLVPRKGPVGVILGSDQSPDVIADDIGNLDLIALEFPLFTDGRPYSYARLLRERMGFVGELRAIGNILRDQLAYMARCGFDALVLPEKADFNEWLDAFGEFDIVYQNAARGGAPAWARRNSESVASIDAKPARKTREQPPQSLAG